MLDLHGYYFYWKNWTDDHRQLGVIAQAVEAVLPELVNDGDDWIKTVDYPKLTAVSIEGTRELERKMSATEARLEMQIEACRDKNAHLEAELEELRMAILKSPPR